MEYLKIILGFSLIVFNFVILISSYIFSLGALNPIPFLFVFCGIIPITRLGIKWCVK